MDKLSIGISTTKHNTEMLPLLIFSGFVPEDNPMLMSSLPNYVYFIILNITCKLLSSYRIFLAPNVTHID